MQKQRAAKGFRLNAASWLALRALAGWQVGGRRRLDSGFIFQWAGWGRGAETKPVL
jgi:hypothetical protein